MLPSKFRLKDKKSFFEVRNKGTLFQGKYIGLSKLKVSDFLSTKVGVVVSTKISKKAVIRNKIRRGIYEGVHTIYKKLPIGYIVVIMAKKSSSDASYQDIKADVVKTLSKTFL